MPYQPINVSASGTTELVAAPGAGRFIRVLGFTLINGDAGTAVTVSLRSASTIKHGPVTYAAGGGESPHQEINGLFDCGINEALNINLSAAVAVGGGISYTVYG